MFLGRAAMRLKRYGCPVFAAIVAAGLPVLANAEIQVPAIQVNANAPVGAMQSGPTDHGAAPSASTSVPATLPPPISLVSPRIAPLNSKERVGIAISRRWAARSEMPHAGKDGYVRFLFGAT